MTARAMPAFLSDIKARIEESCARLGLTYPWWIPAYSTLACVVLTCIAFAQRDTAAWQVLVALALTLGPSAIWGLTRSLLPPWVEAITTTTAVALYLTHPASPDFAPLLFMIMAGEVAATSRVLFALAVSTVDIAILLVAADLHHLQSAPLFIVGVILGVDVGVALRWQMRALNAERANTAIIGEKAMLDERQRLAREVHDVVGHSLSINLLHVTAARHSLQQHADVADALESLVEAERVGRAAMADLRRTVSVLSSGPSETQALPTVADVPALVEQSRLAGLDVHFDGCLENLTLGDSASLGVYRIVQESLANIARHAPTAHASVCVRAEAGSVVLAVRNTLPAGPPGGSGDGRGLPGMTARAEQMGALLRAGVDDDCWLVELNVPGSSMSVSG